MKKWYQKLSHPWAKSAAGFTLVELVVVIAIMGILGGVGAVGYSGYAKKAAQKADETIVSNVIRAVDTGIKSGLYDIESVMQIEVDNAGTLQQSGIQLPVGFVVLDTNGTKVLTATNSEKTTIGRDCQFVDISTFLTNNKVFDANSAANTAATNRTAVKEFVVDNECKKLIGSHTIYKVVDNGVYSYAAPEYVTSLASKLAGDKICLTHSILREKQIHIGVKDDTKATKCKNWLHEEETTTIKTGERQEMVIDFNASKFVCCDENSQTKFETYGDNYTAGPDEAKTTMLSQSLNAAFGDYTTVKLQSTDWVEASTIPTFYSNVSGMFDDVENLSNLLMGIVKVNKENYMGFDVDLKGTGTGMHVKADLIIKQIDKTATITKDTHDSSSDLVYDIANKVVRTHTTEDAFINNAWKAIDTNSNPYDQEGFGLNGREYFLAARTGYNLGFAEYVGSKCPDHSAQIKAFGQPAVDLVLEEIGMASDATMTSVMNGIIGDIVPNADVSSAKMPYCVQASVFGDAALATKFPFTACETCKNLYKQYKDSGTCEENGRAFYQMMVTAAQTPENLVNGTNEDTDFFDYYEGYVDAFGELYRQAQTAANNGAVVISVYMDKGAFDYAVSPNSLDARNKVDG